MSNKRYPEEFKIEAVKQVIERITVSTIETFFEEKIIRKEKFVNST